jgi:peptidoglycan/LPS O-acetylase OafA/YrhL
MPWHLGKNSGRMGYQPGLDGLRAVAVLGVLFYHAGWEWMPGGFLGVDVFFVLSGFLITSIILEEYDRTGGINFRQFYLRRARRLLPALLLMLSVVGLLALIVYRDAARAFASDAVSALLYVTNWWYIVAEQSYFEYTGRPALLKHLWSLAVEEQFYLIWPAIAFLLMRRGGRRMVLWVAIALALLSTAWMTYLAVRNQFPEYNDPSRIYFGTDAHAMGLLVGAGLATVWRPGALSPMISASARRIITGVGVVALLATLWFFGFVGEFTPWLYRGGFLVIAVIVAILIAAATHPASPFGGWLGSQPMRYIGQRSYGIYLWHWPIFMFTRPFLDVPFDGLPNIALRFALTFAVAEVSFRYVEMPIRRGALGRLWHRFGNRIAVPVTTLVIALAVALIVALFTAPRPSAEEGLAPDVAAAIGVGGPLEVLIDDPAAPVAVAPTPSATAPAIPDEPVAPEPNPNGPMSVIGDSVVLGARQAIRDAVPGARVDAEVSRMPGAFIGRIKKLRARDKLADVVVVHPATNGVLPEAMMREMLDLLAEYPRVVIVNAQMPRNWRKPNNSVLAEVVPDYPNAVLVDWFAASKEHPEWFASDGIHLNPEGARQFAALIRKSADLTS